MLLLLHLACAGPSPDAPAPGYRPLTLGHRGAPVEAPENTLASIAAAFDAGVDMVEVDLRLSSDGVAVLLHDATVDKTTDHEGPVGDFTAQQLSAMDAGSWFDPAFADQGIPTLAQGLELAEQRGGGLYLDIKVASAAEAIVTAMDEAGADPARHINSHSLAPMLIGLETALPDSPRVLWIDDQADEALLDAAVEVGAIGVEQAWGEQAPDMAAAARERGLEFWTYGTDDRETIDAALALGVDALESDDPRLLVELVDALAP